MLALMKFKIHKFLEYKFENDSAPKIETNIVVYVSLSYIVNQ